MEYEKLITLFLEINPEPTDAQVHSLADAINVDHQELEAVVYRMLSNELHAGRTLYSAESLEDLMEPIEDLEEMQGLAPLEEDREVTEYDGEMVTRRPAPVPVHANDWIDDVKVNPSAKKLPEGLFTKGPSEIAEGLMRHSEDYAQAVRRLNFYKNRAGKNLDATEKNKLEQAMELLQQRYGDKD